MATFMFEQDPRMCLKKSEETFKDWHYKDIVTAPSDDYMTKTYDYTHIIPTILNQHDTGFCWAYSTALMQAAYEYKETNRKLVLSPLYIAKKGKETDKDMSTEGSTIKNAVDMIVKYGTVQEDLYPSSAYTTGSLTFPSVENEDSMRHYKSLNYARCDCLEDIVLALSKGKLPLLGIQCTKTIYDTKDNKTKYVEFDPNGKLILIGGHQMVVVGWFPEMEHNGHKGFLKCANSWGTTCGENGFIYIPRDYIEFETKDIGFSLFMDAFATVDLNNDNIKQICVEMQINNKEAFINDKKYILDSPPVIKKDRAFVPIRFIAEAFGAEVKWSETSKKVTIKKDNSTIYLYINKDYALVNGNKITLDVAPYIEKDRCMIPVRFVSEYLGFVVLWHGSETNKITILK